MTGETAKTEAVCLSIHPWSRTSHIVSWLSREGRLSTSVKGAVRPKSAFLGQYDLNYTCELVYYANSRGGLHALRECAPLEFREGLRGDWRALLAAAHFRAVAEALCPQGPEAAEWFSLLCASLDGLCAGDALLPSILAFETAALRLAGLDPAPEAAAGRFALRAGRSLAISPQTAACIAAPFAAKNSDTILLDAARAIGVFYSFHLDQPPATRRAAIRAATVLLRREAGGKETA